MRVIAFFIILYFAGPIFLWLTGKVDLKTNYLAADRTSAKIAPSPFNHPEAIIQIYAARAFNWRGFFSVHTWIAVKPANASQYQVFQVIGWRIFYGLPVVVMQPDIPDRHWFGANPRVILDIRGEKAQALIPKITQAAETYPYPNEYKVWPGPNSNTFTADIARKVPELGLMLPANAVGKDFLGRGIFFARAPSNTGWQVSLYGLLGITLAWKEGLEINTLGLNYGVSPFDLSVSLPGIGRIGF